MGITPYGCYEFCSCPRRFFSIRLAPRYFRLSVSASNHFIGPTQNNFSNKIMDSFRTLCRSSIQTVQLPSTHCLIAGHSLSRCDSVAVSMRSTVLSRFWTQTILYQAFDAFSCALKALFSPLLLHKEMAAGGSTPAANRLHCFRICSCF
jgi:hypothetical protein